MQLRLCLRVLLLPLTLLASLTQAQTSQPVATDICSNPIRDSCAFYETCLEAQYHCGSSGYPLNYGLKYCSKLTAVRPSFSGAGQTWMLATELCLQRALVPYATAPLGTYNCDQLRAAAFGNHADCYVQNGLCSLPVSDWVDLVDTVGILTLVESEQALVSTLEAAADCIGFYTWLLNARWFARRPRDASCGAHGGGCTMA